MITGRDLDTISHSVRGIQTRGISDSMTSRSWENLSRQFFRSDEWIQTAAPFVSCARMADLNRARPDDRGRLLVEAGRLLNIMILSADEWLIRTIISGQPISPKTVTQSTQEHDSPGGESMYEHVGRAILTHAVLSKAVNNPILMPPYGKGPAGAAEALKTGAHWAQAVASRLIDTIPDMEFLLSDSTGEEPTEKNLLHDVTYSIGGPYPHLACIMTALAEGMSREPRFSLRRLRSVLLLQGGWDPALELGVGDGTLFKTARDYHTSHDMTLWAADIIKYAHTSKPIPWPADGRQGAMLASKGEEFNYHEGDNGHDPGANLAAIDKSEVALALTGHNIGYGSNAHRVAIEPDMPGEAYILDRMTETTSLMGFLALNRLGMRLHDGDWSVLRTMLDEADKYGAPFTAEDMSARLACGFEEEGTRPADSITGKPSPDGTHPATTGA